MPESQDDIAHIGTEVANWSIKAFSVEMRDQINRAARQADCTVAEWLHGHFVRFGIAGQQFDPVKLDQGLPAREPVLQAKFYQDPDGGPSDAVETAVLVRTLVELCGAKGIARRARDTGIRTIQTQLDRIDRRAAIEPPWREEGAPPRLKAPE